MVGVDPDPANKDKIKKSLDEAREATVSAGRQPKANDGVVIRHKAVPQGRSLQGAPLRTSVPIPLRRTAPLIGYWVGRYGETTGRDRTHAPFLSVAVVTFVYALGGLALRFVIGEPAPARHVLLETLFQGIALNLILTLPVYAIVRRLLPARLVVTRAEGAPALG